jgi:hypothetical protein
MNTPTRQPPRFVPTLTEVVDAPHPRQTTANPNLEAEPLIAAICQQFQPLLAQHLHEINARMQSDIELLVRQAVMDALKTQNRPGPTAAPVNL